jgi:energy-coupling factor transporter ATP-binding protein EcfA2
MNIEELLQTSNGARFYKCALQVNTFDYVKRHAHPTSFSDEAAYNRAVVTACIEEGVEVIAIADHYRIKSGVGLMEAAKVAGIIVFPGFEAVSREGIHFLCLFDPSASVDSVQGRIHNCGIHDEKSPSAIGDLNAHALLEGAPSWPAQIIAAHLMSAGGLFRALQAGQARSAVWRNEKLQACAIPGSIADAPEEMRPILENKNPDYARARPIAVLNCSDVCGPDDVTKFGAWCWIKMTSPTLEGLRQAFLDPGSRVRLKSDPEPEEHVEFVGMWWETEGFLRECRLRFNENLNVLIGGRGAGKSSVMESLRYVLGIEPIGTEAKRVHDGIVQGVLRSGTKISLLVQSYNPDKRLFLIERTVPNPPRVIDASGNVLPVKPTDVVRGAVVFGQNELAEVARNPDKLTALLQRFVPQDGGQDAAYGETQHALETNRRALLELEGRIATMRESLDALPAQEEELRRYREAGVEEKLKSQQLVVKAESVVRLAKEALSPIRQLAEEVASSLPVSSEFAAEEALRDFYGLAIKDDLASLRGVITTFNTAAQRGSGDMSAALAVAEAALNGISNKVATLRASNQADFERALRELQKDRIDGDLFIKLRESIERLVPVKDRLARADEHARGLWQKRRNDLAKWEDLKRERFQRLERAARTVSRELPNRLRVRVTYGSNREPLIELLRSKPGGRLAETFSTLSSRPDLSLTALSGACRVGPQALVTDFRIPSAQAQRLVQAGSELPMLIEELELPHHTEIELNVGPENAPPVWRKLDELSTGQKATALLYLLLLDAQAPLVLDQPEDNLDNRFISEGVVPKIRSEKRRRQFVFATHNANIPVLGDAELIIAMRAVGEAGDGRAEVPPDHIGAIDKPSVAELVEEILEGGEDAFKTRQLKYGF